MDEIADIQAKYDDEYISKLLSHETVEELNRFAAVFYKDVAEIYDCITRVKNIDRNPYGFSLLDAPILGLLVKIWKLLKEIVEYYEKDNADIINILERPLIEASITASYLLKSDSDVINDYRKCSYKDRLKILREADEGSAFFLTKSGQRLLNSVNGKMEIEGYTEEDFEVQKRNRWKLQGKNFFEIFKEVYDDSLYKYTYGMMSDSIHGSWNDSMDYCLQRDENNTFSVNPFYQKADIRFISPTLTFCNTPYKLWLERIDAADPDLIEVLNWVERVNLTLFRRFDQEYD